MMPADRVIKVLFIDDERMVRKAFRLALAGQGMDVDLAGDAEAALALAAENHYDVIASDLNMPGVNGLGLIEKLYAHDPDLSFVLVTGASDPAFSPSSVAQRSIASIVQKPWEPEALAQTVLCAAKVRWERRRLRRRSSAVGPAVALRLLLVETVAEDAERVALLLGGDDSLDYEVLHCHTLADARLALRDGEFDAVLTDLSLPDARGLDTVTMLQQAAPHLPIVVLSGQNDEAIAIESVRLGAQDYIIKGDIDQRTLHRCVRYSIERKRTERRLVHLAHYDALTGLANRTLFRDRAEQALARQRRNQVPHAVLLLDLDRFKLINDTLGHDAGDQLLVAVAERLRAVTRASDTVARLGGDEFVVLLDSTPNEGAVEVADRILSMLARPIVLEGREFVVTTSIGIAMCPDNGVTVDTLLKSADAAMYRAKADGRDNYQFFDHEMHVHAIRRIEVEHDLRAALRNMSLELAYQPQACLRTGRITGVEALMRWTHPTRGPIRPDQFVPILEETGLIGEAGRWVLASACLQAREWQLAGMPDLRIAVNVSPRQLDDPRFADTVANALRASGLPSQSLELEITESSLVRDRADAAALLSKLSELGVRIAIDDFGTGYSSLSQLTRFPIDVLKIDRSFVRGMSDGDGTPVVRAVLELGHALRLEVVAEGVEYDYEWKQLEELGCDLVQGYYLARPMDRDACGAWLAERSVRVRDLVAL